MNHLENVTYMQLRRLDGKITDFELEDFDSLFATYVKARKAKQANRLYHHILLRLAYCESWKRRTSNHSGVLSPARNDFYEAWERYVKAYRNKRANVDLRDKAIELFEIYSVELRS